MFHRLRLHWSSLCTVVLLVILISACNDAPSIVGSEVIQPTDSTFAASLSKITSDSAQMFSGDSTLTERMVLPPPGIRGPLLLGSTSNSDARILLSWLSDQFKQLNKDSVVWDVRENSLRRKPDTTFKKLGVAIAQDSVVVVSCRLNFSAPNGVYVFGDTLDSALSFRAFEIMRPFSGFATWDSIYDGAGNTALYDVNQQPLGQFTRAASTTPTEFQINAGYMERMLKLGIDPATSAKAYGIALQPHFMKSIRQVDGFYVISVELRKVGSSRRIWTRQFTLTPTNVLQTPDAAPDEAVIQGGRKHTARVMLNLDPIDTTAIIFDGELSLPIDKDRSVFGTNLQDQGVVVYSPLENADTVVFSARISSDRSRILVSNFGQRFRRIGSQTVSVGEISMGRFLEEYVQRPGRRHPIYIGSLTNTRLDRISLMKSTNAPGQRPFLRVYYSNRKATP